MNHNCESAILGNCRYCAVVLCAWCAVPPTRTGIYCLCCDCLLEFEP